MLRISTVENAGVGSEFNSQSMGARVLALSTESGAQESGEREETTEMRGLLAVTVWVCSLRNVGTEDLRPNTSQ